MATGSAWAPTENGVREISSLLHEYLQPGVDQTRIFEKLKQCSQFPDFNNYLTFILCKGEGQPPEVRQSAGLLLKNNVKGSYATIAPQFQAYIKGELLPCIGAGNKAIRTTAGTVISVIAEQGGLQAWPEILQAIVQCLDSNDFNHMEGAMDALYKMCEDIPQQLDSDVPGLAERPVNVFLPRLLQLFQSSHPSLRRMALGSVNQFVLHMPRALLVNMDTYLKGLFALATDQSGEIRKLVCAAIVQLIEVQPDFLHPHMRNVVEYMLQATQDPDPDVALEACEFWSAYSEGQQSPEALREFLPRLINVLLINMAYADDDDAVLDVEDDESAPDNDQDLKPRFHQAKIHGGEGGAADEGEEEDDAISAWNLRKCSAAGLDILSNVFGDEILPILMPLIQLRLADGSDEKWKEREAAVLAIGAVAEGCITGLLPALSQIVKYLVPLLEDKHPLVRSITCWTLSRFSKFISEAAESPEGQAQFDEILSGLLRRILDPNKRVQEAACSAFATLEEEAVDELPSRLEPILQHLMFAFGKYQRKNMRILYDAIGTLAECVGSELQEPKYMEMLMGPLTAKWQQLADNDKDLFPLLECLTSIAQALGQTFAAYAEPIFGRCLHLIRLQLAAQEDPARAGIPFDREFIICSLDLLSGLVEALGPAVDPLVGRSDLTELLLRCCGSESADVRQSAFALVGDIAKSCPQRLSPRLNDFLGACTLQLQGPEAFAEDRVSVANNACWAIGEIAVKIKSEVAPVVVPVLTAIVPILSASQTVNRSLMENSAITLGRLASSCTDAIAPHMHHFISPWAQTLSSIRDDVEKEDAFFGLCALIRQNPTAAAGATGIILQAVASWHEIHSQDLRNLLTQVLQGLKQMLVGQGAWDATFGSLEPPQREKLAVHYAV